MKISYSWLKEYINTDIEADKLAKILTSIGLEVESFEMIEQVKGGLKGVVIGEVLTCEKHPDADKLTITTVDVGGEEPLNIVCGAPNVAIGQKVAVATIGTTLYFNNQELTLKKTKIRGQLSEGMICAEDELGLGTSHDGIMVLEPDSPIGMAAADYFKIEDDFMFEIGLTPNRIDAASHYGVARDLAAYLKLNPISDEPSEVILSKPSVDGFRIDNKNLTVPVEVVNPEACPRYSGITISNVKVTSSPEWLQKRLRSIGQSPINNVVDVTNFVLHEIGQPLHAFDADKIEGQKVVVRTLPKDTSFTTLDGIERKLNEEDLMICSTTEGMCIAGVFGGTKSGVTENTRNIFLESACFNPGFIRKTSKRHGLNTDASFRFERGTDPNITVWALKRAALLIKEIAGGVISSEVIDVYPKPIDNYQFDIELSYLNKLIGKDIPVETVKTILESLEISVIKEVNNTLSLSVPPYRVDVTRPADIVEEVLRIYGFNNIETGSNINSTLSHTKRPEKHSVINLISDSLSANGFAEIMCNSLTKKAYYSNLNHYPEDKLAEIINPLSNDLNVMRQTLLFGGLESVQYNINHRNPNLKLYEWGNCYFYQKPNKESSTPLDSYSEELMLGIWLCGNEHEESWTGKPNPVDFFHLKATVNAIVEKLGISSNITFSDDVPSDIFEYGLKLTINKKECGYIGQVSNKLCRELDIKSQVFYGEMKWNVLFEKACEQKVSYSEIPKYPEVRRDLALLLDTKITFDQIKALALATERKLIKEINLFDVYQGEKLGEGKKSYAVSFILQDTSKTLTDNQIDRVMQNLMETFQKELSAQIR